MAFQLGKFVPPQIHKVMMEGNYNSSINTKRKKLTVFFSDIENFTETSENLQPEDLTKYLNEYFSEMTKIALKNGATIDKYIGDALMVFFGDPVSQGESQDARLCVEMALQMNEKIKELRVKWLNEGFANPFKIRIGINTGYCNVGNFGSEQRLTYTIIGGEVNVAARLESIGVAGEILVSYETLAHVKDMINFKQKTAIKMKGIKREIKVYSVLSRNMQMIPNERNEEMKYLIQQNLNKSLELLDHIKKEDFLRLQKLIIDFKNNINQI
jgi:class 3 adenylate cyclase